ncbi:MAG TPA: histidine kinase [Cyanobacteria bacterium UBA11149]|nr:histidine kinase [Cyanobacteria bacterium UBA11367]HBE58996.1 histidine kinase [Cyanobacteria bacterium UBA11366]HBK63446.1 histidine kinase [Cyanobacteria bacterium UBA11166]HBR76927.1 histidine kinase [Cyanobacteria bacterium UBA11159]HBS68315.1 histidine kinase [Cyanobacteria bacterium UBA11153]HBW91080.1 histidine kinase [Cyanobacteria bacterium UBA11149]HCA94732.1 histidine kinase [Cyanobacteria bacterium UBA9226]
MGFRFSSSLPHLYQIIRSKTLGCLKTIALALILVICLFGIIPTDVYAATQTVKFGHITADEGLSQSGISYIFQDSQGFMWFGTQDGLNKYDGYDFTVYKYNEKDPDSLSDNFVSSIYEDKSGNLWIGTDSGGLNKFNRKTEEFTHYQHDLDNPHSLGANRVLSIYQDKLGTLWIGTDGGGLNQFNPETKEFIRYTHNPKNPDSLGNDCVFSIYEDSLDNFWVGTAGGGLNQLNRETGKFTHYTYNPANPNSLSNDYVLSIYEDLSHRIWLGTNGGGLNQLNRENGEFIRYQNDPDNPNSLNNNTVNSIAEDRLGNLWLATTSWYGNSYGKGLDKFNPQTGEFTHYQNDPFYLDSLSDNLVISIWKDTSDILWIGTAFNGINTLDTKDPKFTHYKNDPANPNSLSGNHIMSIAEDRSGIIWIGTAENGLERFDRKTGTFTHYTHNPGNPDSISSNNIWSIYEDKNGTLWVGTLGKGLNKFDRKTEKFIHYTNNPNNPNNSSDNTVVSIYEDSLHQLWVGTFGGLGKFDRDRETFTFYIHNSNDINSISDNNISSIYEDKSGTLWIGTISGGLNKFNRETGEFTHYKNDPHNPNSISYNRVLSIYEYPKGTLWLGTFGGGLDKFDIATETFTYYTVAEGLPNNSVVGILPDDLGNLWLSTGKGLSKFNPETETFRNYDVTDGLQGNEFDGVKANLKSKTGEIFFGGLNGFNSFYPAQVKDNPYIPPIVVTDFKIFEKPVTLDAAISTNPQIKLSYKDNFFSFQFAALDYTNPIKNQYAYKLEGFDKDWIYSGSRRYASYTNLDGGNYIFRVKGSNNDGVWNEEGAAIHIYISPPPWKTWWAYSLYFLGLAAIIALSIQWYIRENALKKEKELNQLRIRLVSWVTHEFRTPLTIIHSSDQMLQRYGNKLREDKRLKHHQRIEQGIYKMNQLVDDVLLMTQAEQNELKFTPTSINLVDLCHEIIDSLKTFSINHKIVFTLEGSCSRTNMDKKLLKHIFENLLSNAIKYSPEGGNVIFSVTCQESKAVFYVKDTGIGIPPDDVKNLFKDFKRSMNVGNIKGTGLGLSLVKKCVELHKGEISVESVLGKGTEFTVILPLY